MIILVLQIEVMVWLVAEGGITEDNKATLVMFDTFMLLVDVIVALSFCAAAVSN